MNKTNQELGEILANETLSVTEMDMQVNHLTKVDKQKWVYFHVGFMAGLKIMGKEQKDCDEILKIAQDEISKIID